MDVAREGLVIVRTALGVFRADMAGVGYTAASRRDACLSDCRYEVARTEDMVAELEELVKELEAQLLRAERQAAQHQARER